MEVVWRSREAKMIFLMALESDPGPHKSEAYILMIAEPYPQPTEAHISEGKKK